MELWTALGIGFLGSFHCLGMCGPIAMALPGSGSSTASFVAGRFIYNGGRILSYALMGMVFGLIGYSVNLAGMQKALSVTLGLLIIASVLFRMNSIAGIKQHLGIDRYFERLQKMIRSQFKKRGQGTLLIIGILNGFLPCGLVYLGLAGSLTTGSVWGGGLFMVLFGLGTLPAMGVMSFAPGFIGLKTRRRINRVLPYLVLLFGFFLIYRGLAVELAMPF